MPSMIFYSAIGAEILRIASATSNIDTCLVSVRSLVKRMIKQGAKIAKTAKVLRKTYGRHKKYLGHIASNAKAFVNVILQ